MNVTDPNVASPSASPELKDTPSEVTSPSAVTPSTAMAEEQKIKEIAYHTKELIRLIGENPDRHGLLRTPERVAKAQLFLTQGYEQNPVELIKSAIFQENFDEMVMIRNIEFSSMCEHHMVPFFGRVHIAYYPDNKLVGLSKLPRAVDALARRLQIQERLTTQLRDAIEEALNPRGVAIAIEATHMCMVMRGVQKQGALTVTRAFSGLFEEESRRAEFLNAIRE